MNIYKNYTVRIDANPGKCSILNNILSDLDRLSKELFFNYHKLAATSSKQIYKVARASYPNIPSKTLQNFIKQYTNLVKNGKRLKKPVKAGIFLDQNFKFVMNDNRLTNFWMKFNKLFLPLQGKYLNKYVKSSDQVHFAHIYKKQNKFYCRLTLKIDSKGKYIDIINKENSEDGYRFIKNVIHSTDFSGKNDISIKNELHKLATKIKDDLMEFGTDVLFIPNRETFVSNTFREEICEDGKNLRKVLAYFPYRLFTDILKSKCLECGISVITDPKKDTLDTSKVVIENSKQYEDIMSEYMSKRKRKIPKVSPNNYLNAKKYDGPTLLMSHTNADDATAMAIRVRRTLERMVKEKSKLMPNAYIYEAIMIEYACHKIVLGETIKRDSMYSYIEDYFCKTIDKVSVNDWVTENIKRLIPNIPELHESEKSWSSYIRKVIHLLTEHYTELFMNCVEAYMKRYYKYLKLHVNKDFFIRAEISKNINVKMFTPIQFAMIDYSQMPYLFC